MSFVLLIHNLPNHSKRKSQLKPQEYFKCWNNRSYTKWSGCSLEKYAKVLEYPVAMAVKNSLEQWSDIDYVEVIPSSYADSNSTTEV